MAHPEKSLDIDDAGGSNVLQVHETSEARQQYLKYQRDYFISKDGWVMDIDMADRHNKIEGKKSVLGVQKSSSATQQWEVQYLDEIAGAKGELPVTAKPV